MHATNEINLQSQFDRLPPHDIAAEMCLIASMILDPHSREELLVSVPREAFFQADHQIMFDAIGDMHRAGQDVDGVTFRAELDRRQLLEECGGTSYLAEILNSVPSAASGQSYAAIVREKAKLRQLISISNDLLRSAYAPARQDIALDIAQEAMNGLLRLVTVGRRNTARKIGEIVRETLDEKEKGNNPRIPFGLDGLDSLTGGMRRGNMTVVAGKSGMGKSQFEKTISWNLSRRGVKTGIISIEEDGQKIGENMLANACSIENQRISSNNLTVEDWRILFDSVPHFDALPLWVDDTPMRLSAVEAAITTMAVTHKCEVIFVDYLQLIDPGESAEAATRESQVRRMSNALKMLFKRLNVAGVVLAQLNRASGNDRPALHNLRDSGSIEQDGDLIILLHREDYHHYTEPGYTATFMLEAIVAKNKNGRPGVAPLRFDGAHQRISDWTGPHQPPAEPDLSDL